MATGRVPTTANSPLTTKGDLFGYSTAPARLAVGSNGDTIVADSSTATGLRYTENYAAGKNKIINGDFGIWQRGTSITAGANANVFGPDRYYVIRNGSGATYTISQQTFTPGTAPVAGYEGTFYCRLNQSVAGSGSSFSQFIQKIENVRTFAGQSVTLSFWAKANSTISSTTVDLAQNFGSGGSGTVVTSGTVSNIDTSWQRFSVTLAIPSISGKTIGTNSSLDFRINLPINTTFTVELWGVQVEAGSVATPFQTATGTIQGELAACQRYYQFIAGAVAYGTGQCFSTTQATTVMRTISTMRVAPSLSASAAGNFSNLNATAVAQAVTATSFQLIGVTSFRIITTVAAGLVAGNASELIGANSDAKIEMSAEL